MTGSANTILYRYKLPSLFGRSWDTTSFGIEPYYIRADGRQVKAGKAIIRCVIYNCITDSSIEWDSSTEWATKAANEIVESLNSGQKWCGPKTLHFDKPRSVSGFIHD